MDRGPTGSVGLPSPDPTPPVLSATFRPLTYLGLYLLTLPVWSQTGALDPQFGDGGIVQFGLAGVDGLAGRDLALTTDGKVLALGTMIMSEGTQGVLCRFEPNGSVDGAFGEGGTLQIGLTDQLVDGRALVALPNGGAVALFALTDEEHEGILMVRITAAGLLDPTFGTNGMATTWPEPGFSLRPHALALTADGSLLVGGSRSEDGGDTQALLLRYTTNGDLDPDFGDNGRTLHGLGWMGEGFFEETILDLAVDPISGRITAAGYCEMPMAPGERAFKLLTDADGISMPFQGTYFGWGGGPAHAAGVALAANGDLAFVGTNGNDRMSFVHCDPSGEELNTGSIWFVDEGFEESQGMAVAFDAEGRVLLAGTVIAEGGARHFALERLNADLTPDGTFGSEGGVVTPVGNDAWAEVARMHVQSDDAILVIGTSHQNGKEQLAIVRYLGNDGVGTDVRSVQAAMDFHLFPNPATDHFNVQFEGSGSTVLIELLDVTGRRVSASEQGHGQGRILHAMSVPSGSAPGHYLVRLTSDQGVRTGRLVVR